MFPATRFRLEIVEEFPSSQELVLTRRGTAGFHGCAVLVLRQTAGYGRRGRDWESGRGNLALSFGLEIGQGGECLPLLPFAVGLAAHRAARELLPAGADLRLKWPNDLYLDGKKLSGLIAQARQMPGGISEVAVGIGMNLAESPDGIDQEAVALAAYGAAPSPEAFARSLLTEVECIFTSTRDFDQLRGPWEQAARLGADPLYVVGEDEPLRARALLPTGELLVENGAGRPRRLASEEVSVRFRPAAR